MLSRNSYHGLVLHVYALLVYTVLSSCMFLVLGMSQ